MFMYDGTMGVPLMHVRLQIRMHTTHVRVCANSYFHLRILLLLHVPAFHTTWSQSYMLPQPAIIVVLVVV